jgi:hypothetical protein
MPWEEYMLIRSSSFLPGTAIFLISFGKGGHGSRSIKACGRASCWDVGIWQLSEPANQPERAVLSWTTATR